LLGGAANWLKARPTEKVEIFNLETRAFETLKDAKMIKPRVRHTVNTLPNGDIVIMGGIVHDIFVEIVQGQVSGGGISGGTITQQFQIDIFPSTNTIEVFSFTDLELNYLTLRDSTRQSLLTSTRGTPGPWCSRSWCRTSRPSTPRSGTSRSSIRPPRRSSRSRPRSGPTG